jgi:hypothetical protein
VRCDIYIYIYICIYVIRRQRDNTIPNGSVYEKILVYACCYYGSRAKKSNKFCARFPVAKFLEHWSVIAGVTGMLR